MNDQTRLEELRTALREERISYGELAELQDLAERGRIPAGDLELLEAAGIPEEEANRMNDAEQRGLSGEDMVIAIRLDAMYVAIESREWDEVERAYDRLRSTVDRKLGTRTRLYDRLSGTEEEPA